MGNKFCIRYFRDRWYNKHMFRNIPFNRVGMGNEWLLNHHRFFDSNGCSLVFLDLRLGLVYFCGVPIFLHFNWNEYYSGIS